MTRKIMFSLLKEQHSSSPVHMSFTSDKAFAKRREFSLRTTGSKKDLDRGVKMHIEFRLF